MLLDVPQASVPGTLRVRNTLVNGNADAVMMVVPEVSHAVHHCRRLVFHIVHY